MNESQGAQVLLFSLIQHHIIWLKLVTQATVNVCEHQVIGRDTVDLQETTITTTYRRFSASSKDYMYSVTQSTVLIFYVKCTIQIAVHI